MAQSPARTAHDGRRRWRAALAVFLATIVLVPVAALPARSAPAPSLPSERPAATALDPTASTPAVERIDGADRFEVAARVSQRAFPDGADVVFLANGLTFPDALSGAPAAALLGGPVLLTTSTALPATIAAELARLQPQRIVLLGGPVSLTPDLEQQLASAAPLVERIAGADRYAVSRDIAATYFSDASTVFIATGRGFPDALAGAGVAAALGAPVVLVDGADARLSPETQQLLTAIAPDRIVILGGPATVVPEIEQALEALAPDVDRLGGTDRFAVSVAISQEFVPTAATALMTTGMNFPDALTGASLAAAGLPLYLVPPTCPTPQVLDDALVRLAVADVVVLGGVNSVSANAELLDGCQEPEALRAESEAELRRKITEIAAVHSGRYSVTVRELDGLGASVSVGGGVMQEPVSVIKVFVAYAVLDRIDGGQLSFSTPTRSGVSVGDCLRVMIHVSDNYCHWDLVALIGEQNLNNQFWAEGYRGTVYAGYSGGGVYYPSKLSTTDDLALLLSRLDRGTLLSPASTDHFITLLETGLWRAKIPSGAPPGIPVGNKTGSAWSASGWYQSDAGIVVAPNGTYVIAVLGSLGATVTGVRDIAQVVYQHFNGPVGERAWFSSVNAVTTSDVTAYRYASTSDPITVLGAGTLVEVDASARTWYRVFFQGSALYVPSSALRNAIDYPRR